MTISPELMKAETRLLRPDVVALVNVRDDHQETLGEDVDLQRQAYLDSLPARSRRVTRDVVCAASAEGAGFARWRSTTDSGDPSLLSDLDAVQRDLVLLADDALATLGWNSAAALQAMVAVARRMDNAPRWLVWASRDHVFLDAFSANDTESLTHLWQVWRQTLPGDRSWSVILATRADRPLRTRRFCAWLAARDDVERVYVTGSHWRAAHSLLRRHGVPVEHLGEVGADMFLCEGAAPSEVRHGGPVLVGIGNSRGLGLGLRAGLSERGA
jgi:hypothetical protein